MGKTIGILIILFNAFSGIAQIYDPVSWETSIKKIGEGTYDLEARATIDQGWHLYSQQVPENGPIPTKFIFGQDDSSIKIIGNTEEVHGKTVYDPVFEMDIKFFEKQAIFRQRVQLLDAIATITATVEFMVCNDQQCLPPKEELLNFKISDIIAANSSDSEGNQVVEPKVKDGPRNEKANVQIGNKEDAQNGLWAIFFIAFLSGFAALLTPCVFPMIPLTVSYFTKQGKSRAKGIRDTIFYGISIILIYVVLGTVITALFGADALNALATNVWFNLVFFLLLVVFAISFLGAFEITLPSSWANRVDAQSYKWSGVLGIFFMALALAIVSFSCTGPIVGTLLVEAAQKGGVAPIIGMFGFSLAIALPFSLFAAFPGWLNSLPKSGGWLNTVKVVLGFLELALAFKFLSQADLVLQLHWLEREMFLAIWIVIFGVLALYLFGKIRLPHDAPVGHISVGRLGAGMIALIFTFYMVPGLWGAPLNLISAFPPPQSYSESPYGVGFSKIGSGVLTTEHKALPEGAHYMEPHDILAFNDYEKGLTHAKKVNKPILIDFTGWACVNCRKMEQNVWPNPKVLHILKNEVVLISLYVDDKRPLDPEEVVDSKLKSGKKLKYIGQKWSELQTIRYKANSQPFYVLMNHDEENLIDPIAYTPDFTEYLAWLEKGIVRFKKINKDGI